MTSEVKVECSQNDAQTELYTVPNTLNCENTMSENSQNDEINIVEGECESLTPILSEDEEFVQPLHLNMRFGKCDPPRVCMDPSIAGYNPFRSDFQIEYDNKAESVLELLYSRYDDLEESENAEDEKLITELKVAIVEGYNLRLNERMKRKNIIREHGLLNIRRLNLWRLRKESEIGIEKFNHLIRFMQFTSGYQFDKLLASVLNYNSLRTKSNKLLNYRHQGLTLHKSSEIYEHLLQLRQESTSNNKKSVAYYSLPAVSLLRKPAPPLKIFHLPGFKQLSEAEVYLCSNQRIIPKDYFKFKQVLITECEKNNGLKLAAARSLIKIDVNKTRKLFDFLIENGMIWKPKQ